MQTYDPETTIPTTFSIDGTPWLRGWQPLLDWLTDQRINPFMCRGFTLVDEGTRADFDMACNKGGKRHPAGMCPGRTDPGPMDEVCFYITRRSIGSLPPYRTPSGIVLTRDAPRHPST